jgi:thiamine monophosphate synthase
MAAVPSAPTKAKPDPVLGLARAAAIVRGSPLTCVAIGGIDRNNLSSVLSAGIDNFAVVRAVCDSTHPRERIDELVRIWRGARALASDG